MRTNPRLKLWPDQNWILNDYQYPQHVLAPGVGYGKTTLGPKWMHQRILINKEPFKYGIIAPTHKLLKECFDAYETYFRQIGWVENVQYTIIRSAGSLEIRYPNGARVLGVSGQNYKTIVAFTFACVWVDEPGHLDDLVYSEILKRVRQGGAKVVQVLRTGVPQGRGDSAYFRSCTGGEYNDYGSYEVEGEGTFVRFRCDGTRLIMHGSTHENPVNDAAYIANLEDDFGWSKSIWDQQIHGLFIGASVNSLYDFDRNIHQGHYPPDPSEPHRWLTWDFNVGQVSWICLEKRGYKYCAVAEYCSARDTLEGCQRFIQAFPPAIYGHHSIIITGDASGYHADTRNRDPRHENNDYEIMRYELQEHYPNLMIVAPQANPGVSLSIMGTNRLFNDNPKTGAKTRLYIDDNCSKLIASLLTCEPDGRGGIKKPTGETWTHPADALRYFVNLVEPIVRTQITTGSL